MDDSKGYAPAARPQCRLERTLTYSMHPSGRLANEKTFLSQPGIEPLIVQLVA